MDLMYGDGGDGRRPWSNTSVNESHVRDQDDRSDASWYRYDTAVGVVMCAAYGLIFTVGLVGNILVIFAVLRTTKLRRCVTNLFLVNLAVADLLVVLFCVPFTLVANLIYRKSFHAI